MNYIGDIDRIRKILLVRSDNIGDVVCTTPCFEALRKHFPNAFIAALVCRLAEEVVAGNPFLDRVYVYDKAKHGRYKSVFTAWWRQSQILWQIRKEHFDLALGVRSDFSPSLGWLVFASGAPYRVGARPVGKHKKFSFYYNIYVRPPVGPAHEVERCLHMLGQIGVDINEKRVLFKLLTKSRKEAKRFLFEHGIATDRPIVCVNFSRRVEEGRYWKYENHVTLIEHFLSHGLQVIATCGPEEGTLVADLLKTSRCEVPLYWSNSLKSFAAVVERCSAFVTVDGGPMHVAAAVGTKVVALYGKADVRVWSPWGNHHVVLKKGDDPNLIHVGEVFETTKEILEGAKTSKDDRTVAGRGVK